MNILAPLTAAAQKSATALAQFGELFNARLIQQSEAITAKKQREINAINLDADRFRDFKKQLDGTLDIISNSVTRSKGLRSQLDGLILTVGNAGADPEAANNADGYRVNPNLLGDSGPARLDYPVDPSGTKQAVRGVNLVSDYYIIDSEGKRFEPDRVGGLIRQVEDDPDATNQNFANLDTGIRLESISGNAISFTLKPGTAEETSFSGELVRKGPGILDPWLYDDFKTVEGRSRALADLEAAKGVFDFEIQRYGSAKTSIEFHRNRANTKVKQADFAIEDISIEQAQAIRIAEAKMAREAAVLATKLEHAELIRNEYTRMFGGTNDPLTKTLLDISV
jgi:hypothetical protein